MSGHAMKNIAAYACVVWAGGFFGLQTGKGPVKTCFNNGLEGAPLD
jgi:hypothetical protein